MCAFGERGSDERVNAESAQPGHEGSKAHSEVVQVGFRVAGRLGHERVHPVDSPMTMGANREESETKSPDQAAMREPALSAFDVELPDSAAIEREAEAHLADATTPDTPRLVSMMYHAVLIIARRA